MSKVLQYDNYERNHVIVKGREKALEEFLKPEHKRKHSLSSNSEDALTWSCFDTLRAYKPKNLNDALNEILEDSFGGKKPFDFKHEKNVKVLIGQKYIAPTLTGKKKETELDVSFETDDKLVFVEAKLYSSISLPKDTQQYNQIAYKLRIGLDYARKNNKQFYFIFLDIAPLEKFSLGKPKAEAEEAGQNFADKWKSAWWFNYYKNFRESVTPIKEILGDITDDKKELKQMQRNMGWLTWASLFKIVLRAAIK